MLYNEFDKIFIRILKPVNFQENITYHEVQRANNEKIIKDVDKFMIAFISHKDNQFYY